MSLEEVMELKSTLYHGVSRLKAKDLTRETPDGVTIHKYMMQIVEQSGYKKVAKGVYLRELEDDRCELFLEKDVSTVGTQAPKTGYSHLSFAYKKTADKFVKDYNQCSRVVSPTAAKVGAGSLASMAVGFGAVALTGPLLAIPGLILAVGGVAGSIESHLIQRKWDKKAEKRASEFRSKYVTKWNTGIGAIREICKD
ncbi:hypothetical protein HOK51_02175 [Candidatus Woesearchaeota archaeon]|jgi:hypothetical protein|nr:hypothetical protein [Candidatus Woesearchaeota archaeon]MBT6518623.1 hypothetical protein [Candidatus Woesearchaeota archaeon]MBT7368052.1 hypothetical protein [Candidatus Woesearchaeota archaeon]